MRNLLFLLSFVLFCTACGGGEEAPAKAEDRTVFHYNVVTALTSLDPAFSKTQTNIWATNHLFDGLVQLDDQLNVQPAIASAWEVSEDGLTYTFTLRKEVFFHADDAFPSGKARAVVASDVVYSLQRIIDEKISSPGSWIFTGRLAEVDPFSAPDESTFVLRLAKPFRPMLGILAMQYCSVVPREAVEKYGKGFRSHPVGTGPFKFKNWIENQSLFLTKNENYYQKGTPELDAVRVSFIGDRKTAYLELKNGKLDFMSGLESSYVDELLTPEGELQAAQKDQLQFIKNAYLNMEYLGIRMIGDNALQNKKVRQALNYGFDREQMLATLRNKVGKPADSGFTPRGLPSYDAAKVPGYSFDTEKARQLLREAGFPDGKGLSEITLYTDPGYQDICTFISRQWMDLGITVKIEIMESATLRQMMSKSQAPFFRGSWIADYPDAENFFAMFYSKNPAPPNYTRFSNADFDRLYEMALGENDDAKRFDFYQQMDRILIEEAPVIFLFYDETALFVQKEWQGISKNAVNLLNLSKVKK